jgi:hypothetical protein
MFQSCHGEIDKKTQFLRPANATARGVSKNMALQSAQELINPVV